MEGVQPFTQGDWNRGSTVINHLSTRNRGSTRNFKGSLTINVLFKFQLTESNAESFLQDAIARNRPRVVYCSRSPSPSLIYHVMALYLHDTLDFAYCSTGQGQMGVAIGRRLGIVAGERTLVVFKEDRVPTLVEQVSCIFHACT